MGKGRGAAVVATIASPFILYLILRSAAGALAFSSPAAAAVAASLPPPDLRGHMRLLSRASQSPQFPAGPGEMALSQRALAASPTAYEPFMVAAAVEEKAGRADRAIQLMEEVRRRRPHMPSVRLKLIVLYGQERRFGDMLGELDNALALNEQARHLILPELTKLIADPQGRTALADLLATSPPWRDEFYRAAKGRKVRPDQALALVEAVRARTGRTSAAAHSFYLQSLIEAGELARARELWLAQLPPQERQKAGLVFDGDFRGSSAPEPFNWVLHDSDGGRAQLASEGGRPSLEALYFGGRNFILAEQRLALTPGRYRLSFQVRSEAGIKNGDLSWRISCTGSGAEIAAVSLSGAGAAWSPRSTAFTVPAGCAGQRLFLVGTPGDLSGEVRVEISSLEVARDG